MKLIKHIKLKFYTLFNLAASSGQQVTTRQVVTNVDDYPHLGRPINSPPGDLNEKVPLIIYTSNIY